MEYGDLLSSSMIMTSAVEISRGIGINNDISSIPKVSFPSIAMSSSTNSILVQVSVAPVTKVKKNVPLTKSKPEMKREY